MNGFINKSIPTIKRIIPKINENINEEWISDKTRYACDGLLKQRLDIPYIKKNGKLTESTWNEAIKTILDRIKKTIPNKIAGFIGDLVDLETMYIFKQFFNKSLNSKNLEFRNKKIYLNPYERINYLFNSTINGIEDSDLVILIGTNPRYEATILNSRIRKSYLKNNFEVYSIGDIGDLTYPYKILPNETKTIKDIVDRKHDLSSVIQNSKKPLVIIGQAALNLKSGKYIFEEMKKYLTSINKITDDKSCFPSTISLIVFVSFGRILYG